MPWSQDEERMLAQIERYLSDDDPRLAARLESFNERACRESSAVRRKRSPRARRRMGRSTVIILVSWLLIATLITTLLIMVFRHDAAALPL
ncbi:DUF3040 domain-containing protein [Sphaerisporangium sp. B11E5]|uniref:DUF3040 domain-containing protein n=1 Tax=Sphaerisporangium sp. B11E5 TaxID=3153563 RepID=UPI00325EA0CC